MHLMSLGTFASGPRTLSPAARNTLREHGIVLSCEEEMRLLASKEEALEDVERIEVGASTLEQVIATFADSPYLGGEDIPSQLEGLIRLFLNLRDELPVEVADEQILLAIRERFEEEAGCLPNLAEQAIRGRILEDDALITYTICDDDGNVYRWDPDEWVDDECCAGWDGESWAGGDDDER